ncbi:MAG TPA: MFS transporter, partial [Candidatus Angelobacter sp.]|nr:MFS transporter [Candidatus Angelobacter sp.]
MPEISEKPAVEASSQGKPGIQGRAEYPLQQPIGEKWRLSFWALNITQFQGAFSTNAFQNLLSYMVLGMGLSHAQRDKMLPLIVLFFSVPLVMFSMAGGFLADRYSKRQVIIGTKLMEIAAMAGGMVALSTGYFPLQLGVLFVVAMQAALFGPSKYGLLPELLPEKWLSWGNGIVELLTFLAIISGTVAAGLMSERFHGHESYAFGLLLIIGCSGLISSLWIAKIPAAAPEKKFRINFVADLFVQVKLMRRDRPLFLAVMGNTYFWFIGVLFLQTIFAYGRDSFNAQPQHIALLQAALAGGIGIGSGVAGYLSGNKIELGLIPLGSFGLTIMAGVLGVSPHSFSGAALVLAMLGFFGGFFAVPVNALIQHRPTPDSKGGIIAASNLLSFVGFAVASGMYFLLTTVVHLSPRGVFLAGAIITLGATLYLLYLLPDWFLRLLLFFLTHTLYRVKVIGRDHIPEKGGALFVSNHMSFVDVLLLLSSTDRPIRFLMFQGIYSKPIVKPFALMMKAIPISSELRPRDMIRSLRMASDAIRDGEIVCIFAEGQITRTGQLLPFRRGMERIIKGIDAPIVPVNLHGVWGSIFSFERNRFLWKVPRRVPYPVTVSFGKWLPPTSAPSEVRQAVQELQSAAFAADRSPKFTLDRAFVRSGRRY